MKFPRDLEPSLQFQRGRMEGNDLLKDSKQGTSVMRIVKCHAVTRHQQHNLEHPYAESLFSFNHFKK
jgi:hypothetical protein